jgi:hypothetical protein
MFLKIPRFKHVALQFSSVTNFFINIYILFVLSFFGYLDLAGEGFVVISLVNVFTHGLSANYRNIYLGSTANTSLKKVITFRVQMGIFSMLFCSLIVYFFIGNTNIFFHTALICLTISSWILELFIAKSEKNSLLNKYYFVNIILFILFFPFLIFFNFLISLVFFIFFYILCNIFISKNYFDIFFLKYFISLKNIKINFNLGSLSSFAKTVSNLIWRYSIYILIDKNQSAILFMAFSLGSFYGTLFDISYGAYYLKNLKKKKKIFLRLFFLVYVIAIFFLIYIFKKLSNFDSNEFNLFFYAGLFSLLGSYFSVIALDLRQGLFEIKNKVNFCYKVDFSIYFFNSLIVPFLYLINPNFLIFSYLIAGLFLYFVYNYFYNDEYKYKNKYKYKFYI